MITISLMGNPYPVGQTKISRDAMAYTARLVARAEDEMAGELPLEGSLKVVARFEIQMPKMSRTRTNAMLLGIIKPTNKPKIDDLLKVLNSLSMVVFGNVSQIVELYAEKRYSNKPKVVITVSQL